MNCRFFVIKGYVKREYSLQFMLIYNSYTNNSKNINIYIKIVKTNISNTTLS